MTDRSIAPGLLLVIVGVWLVLQTIAGDLPRRLMTLAVRSDDPRVPDSSTPSDPSGRHGGGFSAGGGDGGGGGGHGAR